MPADIVQFQWTMRTSELDTLRKALRASLSPARQYPYTFDQRLDDLDDYAHAAFEPLVRISGTIAIDCLVEQVEEHLHCVRQNGLLIDVQGKNLAICEDRAIETGEVLVVSPHGTRELSWPSAAVIAATIQGLAPGHNCK